MWLMPGDLQIQSLRLVVDYSSWVIRPDLDFLDMVWRIDNYLLRIMVGQ